ncbi:hypothetical protein [Brevundimonas sp. UBA2416]|uniref:hypothetical protein n=1 Tax=Brevundimonas sp. UBA2416 TaxID=1946124 RepID=UPI0025C63071|nr:hypothetical protein [Brevundimonas sp. UBA2416]HRJ64657.1 hypothetical protein [Brevundimonas sp.]
MRPFLAGHLLFREVVQHFLGLVSQIVPRDLSDQRHDHLDGHLNRHIRQVQRLSLLHRLRLRLSQKRGSGNRRALGAGAGPIAERARQSRLDALGRPGRSDSVG